MGLTIHFSGQLRSPEAYARLIKMGREFAEENKCAYTEIAEENKKLLRVTDDEKRWDYEGAVTGLRIDVHHDADPLYLEFDTDLYIQDYIKTQFAGAELHAKVVNFFRRVQPLFLNLRIVDEAEYWETNDFETLKNNLVSCDRAIQEEITKNPGCQVKVRMPDGHIIDLIT